MVALDAALEVFDLCTMTELRSKSLALSELFIKLLEQSPCLADFTIESPLDKSLRGSQIALSHEQAFSVSQALIAHNIVVDYREPNIIRFGFTPLYCRYEDVFQAVKTLENIVDQKVYQQPKYHQRNAVT